MMKYAIAAAVLSTFTAPRLATSGSGYINHDNHDNRRRI